MAACEFIQNKCQVLKIDLTILILSFVEQNYHPTSCYSYTRYDETENLWKAYDYKNKYIMATSRAAKETLLLGSHSWTIYNDSKL